MNQIHCSSPYCIGQTPKVHEADRQNSSRENIWFRLEKDTATSGSVRAPRPHLRQRTPRGSFPGAFIVSRHRRATAFDPRASRNPSGAPHRRAKVYLKQTHKHECASSGEGAMAGASCQQTAAVLRLQSDLRAIKTEPPDVSFHPPRAHRRARFVARGGRAPLPHNPRS